MKIVLIVILLLAVCFQYDCVDAENTTWTFEKSSEGDIVTGLSYFTYNGSNWEYLWKIETIYHKGGYQIRFKSGENTTMNEAMKSFAEFIEKETFTCDELKK